MGMEGGCREAKKWRKISKNHEEISGSYGYVDCLDLSSSLTGVYICLDIKLYSVSICSFYVNKKLVTENTLSTVPKI